MIMVTDGVMDALPAGEQDTLMCAFIEGTDIVNPMVKAEGGALVYDLPHMVEKKG